MASHGIKVDSMWAWLTALQVHPKSPKEPGQEALDGKWCAASLTSM